MKLQQSEGELGLLYTAIVREKPQACLFLLEHGADYKIRWVERGRRGEEERQGRKEGRKVGVERGGK